MMMQFIAVLKKYIHPFMGIAILSLALLGLIPYNPQSNTASDNYTFAEVIAAYEAGQFRVINTRSVWMHASPDGSYVGAKYDGIYRLSDGKLFDQYDSAMFSPDSLYVAQENNGVYRLSDAQKMFDIGALPRFTPNSEYVAADGYGVFHLPDGQKLFHIDDSDKFSDGLVYTFYSHFSSNGNYVVIDKDGVYRLSDLQKLFDIVSEGLFVNFSRDEQYVASAGDGVYRLSDGKKLFEISGYANFSPDVEYVVSDNAIYRLPNGEKLLDILGSTWSFSSDGVYISVTADGVYNIESGERLFSISADAAFSPDGLYVAVSDDGLYRLSDGQKIFNIVGQTPEFSEDNTVLITSGQIFGDVDNLGNAYRVHDGYRLFGSSYGATLSQDGLYAAVGTDGLYRIDDGQRLFEIEEISTSFTTDGNYIIASSADSNSVYRINDGYRYQGLRLMNIPAGIIAIGNTILVVDPTQHSQKLSFIRTQPHAGAILYNSPDKESERLSGINGGVYLAILSEQGAWYQVSYNGKTGWIPTDSYTTLYLPE